MKIEQVTLEVGGRQVFGDWYDSGSESEGSVLTLGGLGSQKDKHERHVTNIVKATGLSAFVLDYSGHGLEAVDPPEAFSPAQHLQEVAAAYEWMAREGGDGRRVVMGTSYGGYLAAALAGNQSEEISGLVLRSAAMYPPDLMDSDWSQINAAMERVAIYRRDPEALAQNPTLREAARLSRLAQVLIIHHELDDECPEQVADAYVQGFSGQNPNRVTKWVAEGFHHSMGPYVTQEMFDAYEQMIIEWLNQLKS